MFLVSWFVWDLSFGCLAAGALLHYLFGGWFGGLRSAGWLSCFGICWLFVVFVV